MRPSSARRPHARLLERGIAAAILGWSVLAGSVDPARAQEDHTRILVGPNILVTKNSTAPHAEVMVAADPNNARHLLGTGIDLGRSGNRTYVTTDGGNHWLETTPIGRHRYEYDSADPQVAFGADGTAYFVSSDYRQSDTLRTIMASNGGYLHLHRSLDGGLSWQEPVSVDPGYLSDHPQMAVDRTTGRFAGRVYVGAAPRKAKQGAPDDEDSALYNVSVYHSTDDGQRFSPPVEAVKPRGGGKGVVLQVITLVVLSDGTLFVGVVDLYGEPKRYIYRVLSRDGGMTFSELERIQTVTVEKKPSSEIRERHLPVFAVDTRPGRFQDRIYCVWDDRRYGTSRILLSYSMDAGSSWSEPKRVDSAAPKHSHQYLPAVSVNRNGVVGVSWYDTRESDSNETHPAFFSASTDGGESFLPSVRLSSRERYPRSNSIEISPSALDSTEHDLSLRFYEPKSWPGHYSGLAADATGIFHPFWVDTRRGNTQIWTTRVDVRDEPAGSRPETVRRSVIDRVRLVYDPAQYDPNKKEATIPVRVENISSAAIYRPILVEVKKLAPMEGIEGIEGRADSVGWRGAAPVILNAPNGKPGKGAIFDFSEQLGDFDALPPGAVSSTMIWRVRLVDPAKAWMHLFHMTATGLVVKD